MGKSVRQNSIFQGSNGGKLNLSTGYYHIPLSVGILKE